MKLPGWQASTSTAMPKIGAPQLGAPKMVIPKVMKFTALDNPNDYLRLGAAKQRTNTAVLNLALKTASLYATVKEADQVQSAKVEVAKHAEELARRQAGLASSPYSTLDENGQEVFGWESAVEDFDVYTSGYKEATLSRREYGAKGRAILEQGFSANNKVYRTKTQTFVTDRTIDRARGNAVEGLEIAARSGNFEGIKDIIRDGIADGTFGPKEGVELGIKYDEETWANVGTTMINTLRVQASNSGMGKAAFDAEYYNITTMLQSQEFGGTAKSRQLLFKQAVDLKTDYEENIIGRNQDFNAASKHVELSKAIRAGDELAIQELEDEIVGNPGTREVYGPQGYTKLTSTITAYHMQGGHTTDRGRTTLANIEMDLQNGDLSESAAIDMINGLHMLGDSSGVDHANALVMAGKIQDPVIKADKAEAKRMLWARLVKTSEQAYAFMPADRSENFKADADAAYTATEQLNAAIDEGFAKGQRIDVTAVVNQFVVKNKIMDPAMRNSAGKPAKDVWDVDQDATMEYIEQKKTEESAWAIGEGKVPKTAIQKFEERIRELNSVVDLSGSVEKPE